MKKNILYYDVTKRYEENYAKGPYGVFRDLFVVDVEEVVTPADYLLHKIRNVDAVQSATGSMGNPYVEQHIDEHLLKEGTV